MHSELFCGRPWWHILITHLSFATFSKGGWVLGDAVSYHARKTTRPKSTSMLFWQSTMSLSATSLRMVATISA